MKEFTYLQADHICFQIGEWYLKWKDRLIQKIITEPGHTHVIHNLGTAKEDLKRMILGDKDINELMDERFDNETNK